MKDTPRYYVATWNNLEKFIKTTNHSCEILQVINGKLLSKCYPKPYPSTGEEDLMEITAQQYNKVKRQMEAV